MGLEPRKRLTKEETDEVMNAMRRLLKDVDPKDCTARNYVGGTSYTVSLSDGSRVTLFVRAA